MGWLSRTAHYPTLYVHSKINIKTITYIVLSLNNAKFVALMLMAVLFGCYKLSRPTMWMHRVIQAGQWITVEQG